MPAPSERERTQWYFQRYVSHLPAGGEIVLFDRSWYNRAGVERVMGFCTEDDVEEFFRSVPEFERMLVRSGIVLIKYWFSITDEEQHLRFTMRIHDPLKQWKLSPMDVEARTRWERYTKAKEAMLERTHIAEAPWHVVQAVDKKKARLNCIAHLLDQIPYQEIAHAPVVLPRAFAIRTIIAAQFRPRCTCRSATERKTLTNGGDRRRSRNPWQLGGVRMHAETLGCPLPRRRRRIQPVSSSARFRAWSGPFASDADGSPEALAADQPIPLPHDGLLWLHLNLADARTLQWLAKADLDIPARRARCCCRTTIISNCTRPRTAFTASFRT